MTKLNRSIDRGLDVLQAVHSSGTLSLAGLADHTGLPKATLLRICATLEARGWLFRRSRNGRYQIGAAFPQKDGSMPNKVDRLIAAARVEIVQLAHETGLAVDLAADVGGGRVEIIDTTRRFKVHGVYPDTVGFRPSPTLSALGSAFLFALSGPERAQVLQDLADQLPREDAGALPGLAKVFNSIADRGYAVRADGHWGRAVDYGELPMAIAVPVIADLEPIGAVNLVWKESNYTVEEVAEDHLTRLQSAARVIGQRYAERAE